MAYLLSNPPASPQYRTPRREKPSGVVVVHTAENSPDTDGADGSAEAVAAFIARRTDPGSYHDLVDSDSIVNLVPYGAEAYHDATGSNRHSYSVSAATKSAQWNDLPEDRKRAMVHNMAVAVAGFADWIKGNYGITIPARRITREESEARIPGFIAHADRDPANRSDPGAEFDWDLFLADFANLTKEETDEVKPSGAWDNQGRYWVAVTGVDAQIYLKVWDGTRWGDWFSIGGEGHSGPDITIGPSGRVDVVVKGSDGALWHNWTLDGSSWLGWESLGGQVA